MHRLAFPIRVRSALVAGVLPILLISGCSTPDQKPICAPLDPNAQTLVGASLDWPIDSAQFWSFGIYTCTDDVTIKITSDDPAPTEMDVANPYSVNSFHVTFGNDQLTFGGGETFDFLLGQGGASSVAKVPAAGLDVKRDQKFQIFENVTANKYSRLYGVERFKIKAEVFDKNSNLVQTFRGVRDFGVNAPTSELKE
ncbi:MAG: hypothetical protein RLZZ56_1046 [Actinomycetota bacterium]